MLSLDELFVGTERVSAPARQITIGDVVSEVAPDARIELSDIPPRRLGQTIVKWLLWLCALVAILVAVVGIVTYPSSADVEVLLGSGQLPAGERLAAFQALRSQWIADMKDLGQVFILNSIFPILTAVIGYTFGQNSDSREGS